MLQIEIAQHAGDGERMEKNRTFEDVIHVFDEVYQTGTCVKSVPAGMQEHDRFGFDTRSSASK